LTMRLIHACACGDMEKFKKLVEFGSGKFSEKNESRQQTAKRILECGDYDKRTCLHLAAAEGSVDIVHFLVVDNNVEQQQDRWGVTPLHEVRKHVHNMKNADKDTVASYRKILEILSGKSLNDATFSAFVKQGREEEQAPSSKKGSLDDTMHSNTTGHESAHAFVSRDRAPSFSNSTPPVVHAVPYSSPQPMQPPQKVMSEMHHQTGPMFSAKSISN